VLVIVGPGPQAPLAALARARGIADQVRFLGKVPRTTLLALYQACDVFLLPGREVAGSAEGFGVVFLEAALAGKPVVAGCVGGAREAVADGVTGLLVDGDSPADISGAVCRLLNEPGFAATLGAAGRRRVLQEFDGSRQRSAFATLVRELAGTGAAE
jgi:phosphatidylinositol alpha-1,6-mannosyltransferase